MDCTRLFEIPYYQLKHFPQAKSIIGKKDDKWAHYSTQEFVDTANKISLGLLKLGVKPGDKVAVVTYKNRPEWCVLDIGVQQIGAILVPVYPTISSGEYEYIFKDASVKLAFVGSGDLIDKVKAAYINVDSLEAVYTFDRQEGEKYWEDVFEEGDMSEVEALKSGAKPEDLITLIYTSGTTGNPKGVMLSHNNIMSNIKAVYDLIPLTAGDNALSFLPMCHVFERMMYYTYMSYGVNITFTGTDNLGGETGDLKTLQPNFFTTVPRLLEKVYEKIYNKGLLLTGAKKSLFFWALALTEDYEFGKKYSGLTKIKWKIADKLIFSKWREALGGNVKGIVTGAAACPRKMAQVFSAAGIPIREGYGLTETSPVLTVNRFPEEGAMLGTVGQVIDGVTIDIDVSDAEYDFRPGEGEIIAKGPNIMMGYYNKPDKTAEVIDVDGWFHTGDIGTFIEKNGKQFLKITDRKKELLKTSGGKYVAPNPIEGAFKGDFLIEQMAVIGNNRKFVSALIVPSPDALKDWCDKNDVPCTLTQHAYNPVLSIIDNATLENPKVLEKFQALCKHYNKEFSHVEQIKKFKLLGEPWDVSTGELTPTMKLKRRVVDKKFDDIIESMYA
ncbi:MAG: long-chain acyl-CoA synthetase [Cognaticolwellia sp.]|jgi:long-chain acyl-CoA synthetase